MNMPRVMIYLNKGSNLCISELEEQNSEPRPIFVVALDELRSDDLDSTESRVGKTVLDTLERWHKQEFGNWKIPPADEISHDENAEDYDVDDYISAQHLALQARAAKTAAYNASIEFLLQRAAIRSPSAREYLEIAWPWLRIEDPGGQR